MSAKKSKAQSNNYGFDNNDEEEETEEEDDEEEIKQRKTNKRQVVYLLMSPYKGRPGTCFFQYPEVCE